jgi:beta-mannosidase
MSFRLRDPRPWWPVGLGKQPLYNVRFLLSGQDRAGITFSATAETAFGIRTVSISRTKDSEGESFVPQVNGIPVFCRGANWIPVSMLPGDARDADYRKLIGMSLAAGMNCLRVWGGGVYERDLFYDLCDSAGILVWQDFMFACAAYPTYREFVEELELEAEYQIARLRNHPSILTWCGNNENEWIHQAGGLRKGQEKRIIGEQLWETLLRDKVEEHDPSRAYLQSSPFGKDRSNFNDMGSGDRHNWDVWGGFQTYDGYLCDTGRFLSEFGMQALPHEQTIREFAPTAKGLFCKTLLHHQYAPEGQERIIRYICAMFRLPARFEEWIDASQRMQAEVLRRGVEHWRRRKFNTSGTLIWQLHDAHTATSWAIIDFYRRPKLGYEFARRFFFPVLLSLALRQKGTEVGALTPVFQVPDTPPPSDNGTLSPPPEPKPGCASAEIIAVLINDTPTEIRGSIVITSFDGDGREIASHREEIHAAANSNSAELVVTVDSMRIDDIQSQYVRAIFEPDESAELAIRSITETIRLAAADIWADEYDPIAPIDSHGALRADLMLVEPRFFNWPEGIEFFGQTRPVWH